MKTANKAERILALAYPLICAVNETVEPPDDHTELWPILPGDQSFDRSLKGLALIIPAEWSVLPEPTRALFSILRSSVTISVWGPNRFPGSSCSHPFRFHIRKDMVWGGGDWAFEGRLIIDHPGKEFDNWDAEKQIASLISAVTCSSQSGDIREEENL